MQVSSRCVYGKLPLIGYKVRSSGVNSSQTHDSPLESRREGNVLTKDRERFPDEFALEVRGALRRTQP